MIGSRMLPQLWAVRPDVPVSVPGMVVHSGSGSSSMIRLNRILVPTDFSDFSRPAVTYACAMAERFGAQLHVLHVVPDPAMLVPEAAVFSVESMQTQSDKLVADAQHLLQQIPEGWQSSQPVIREVRVGAAFPEIIEYAKGQDIDLIVIGTHGRSGLSHILMGSVAERVVRGASCPVLSVKPTGHQFVMS
ncbi:MAG: universal stress protein [Planctomycetaceae bacterium]